MTEINLLDLKEPDPIDWDHYDTGERKPIVVPVKGFYQFQVAEMPEVGATREGYLMIKLPLLRLIKLGTPEDGAEIRFTNVSAKKWANREGSPLGDFLKAFGISGQRTNAEYVAAAQATINRVCEAGLDWRGYCKQCGTEVAKGMDKFPLDANGVRQTWMDCPSGCQDQTDPNAPRPKRVWANPVVTFFKALK
jgi:hypothetical protein